MGELLSLMTSWPAPSVRSRAAFSSRMLSGNTIWSTAVPKNLEHIHSNTQQQTHFEYMSEQDRLWHSVLGMGLGARGRGSWGVGSNVPHMLKASWMFGDMPKFRCATKRSDITHQTATPDKVTVRAQQDGRLAEWCHLPCHVAPATSTAPAPAASR